MKATGSSSLTAPCKNHGDANSDSDPKQAPQLHTELNPYIPIKLSTYEAVCPGHVFAPDMKLPTSGSSMDIVLGTLMRTTRPSIKQSLHKAWRVYSLELRAIPLLEPQGLSEGKGGILDTLCQRL